MNKAVILAKLNEALVHMKAAQALLVEVDSNDEDVDLAIEAIEEEISVVRDLELI